MISSNGASFLLMYPLKRINFILAVRPASFLTFFDKNVHLRKKSLY
jgi:hypothetical protein